MSADFKSGKPLFVMCCLHMGTARKGGGGGVKARQVGVGDIIEKIIDSQYMGIFTTYL